MSQTALTVKPGGTIHIPLSTYNSSGVLVDADSLPSVTNIQVNGAHVSLSPVVAQAQDGTPANIVGRYHIALPGATLVDGDEVVVYSQAVVASVTVTGTHVVNVVDLATGSPYIE